MKKTASIQKNSEMELRVRGMYGSTANGVERRYGSRVRTAAARPKIHPGEFGIIKGRRVQIETPARPVMRSIRRLFSLRGIVLLLLSSVAVFAAVILMLFNFEKAAVYGNTKYSQQQIESFITRGYLGENTFVMALKYHHRKVKDIPFVDQIDIDIVSPSTIRVNIKEKPTDGCIFYGGKNVYFSKDGVIQTVSGRVVEETTIINGVVLTHSDEGTQALAKNQLGLDLSLELLRAADKYGIRADSIDVDPKCNLTVKFGDVEVGVGKTGYDQKMFRMHQILPYLEGRSGTISMIGYEDGYSGESNIVLSPYAPAETAETEEPEPVEEVKAEEAKATKTEETETKETTETKEPSGSSDSDADTASESADTADREAETGEATATKPADASEEPAKTAEPAGAAEENAKPAEPAGSAEETAKPAEPAGTAEETAKPADSADAAEVTTETQETQPREKPAEAGAASDTDQTQKKTQDQTKGQNETVSQASELRADPEQALKDVPQQENAAPAE